MKKTLLTVILAVSAVCAMAQTFTEPNSDGIELKYTVSNTSTQTVTLEANNYRGHIVVPEQVVHEGVLYTVTSIGTAFKNSTNVTYLEVPSTVTRFEYQSFQHTKRLDTLVMRSEVPMTVNYGTGNPQNLFSERISEEPLLAVVPCGYLSVWRASWWGVMPGLRSDCAVYLAVIPTADSIIRVDSVMINNRAHYSSGWYEVGDTARIVASKYTWRVDGYNNSLYGGQFFGWSTGSKEMAFDHVVTGPDTILAYCGVIAHRTIYANNIYLGYVSLYGNIGYDGSSSQYRVIYTAPNGDGTNASSIFQTALWVGNGSNMAAVRFMANGSDFFPGPLRLADAQTDMATTMRFNHVWRVTRGMINYHIAHCGEEGYVPEEDIATWPGNGPEGYAAQLAPFYDADNNGRYNALAGDYPLIRGDECTFSIFNDAYMSHTESGGEPLGIEVHCMTYSFAEPDSAMAYTIFTHYDIYNRSANTYDNTYLGAFTDFDIGNAVDDYIGCDVQRNMFYGFNGTEQDLSGYGAFVGVPPAQSCTFLGGAQTDIGDRHGMTNFTYYNNSSSFRNGEPTCAADYHHYMASLWRDSTHVTYGAMGLDGEIPCTHMFPWDSDPDHISTGGIDPGYLWTEFLINNPPSDRRGVGSSGPFNFTSGSMQQLDLAYTTAWGSDNINSIRALGAATDNVRRQWLRDTTDTDRPFTYRPYSAPHPVSGIGTVAGDDAVRVYPNPTDGQLRIEADGVISVELYDIYGRCMLVKKQGDSIDLTPIPSGTYILRVTHTKGVSIQQVIKR